MSSMSQKEKISAVYTVAYACPYNAKNAGCILEDLRLLSVVERMKAIRAMAEEELDAILHAHHLCRSDWVRRINSGLTSSR